MSNDFTQMRVKINLLKEESVALKLEDVKLQREKLKLSEDNLRLTRENLKLDQKIAKLTSDNVTLQSTAIPADQRIVELEQEVKRLKKKMLQQEPLFKVGVAIRLQFWEQAKEALHFGKGNNSIIEAGNAAAHRGDVLADRELLFGGYMSAPPPAGTSNTEAPIIEESTKKLYKLLYITSPELGEAIISAPGLKWIEILNLAATLASSYSSLTASLDAAGLPEVYFDSAVYKHLSALVLNCLHFLGETGHKGEALRTTLIILLKGRSCLKR